MILLKKDTFKNVSRTELRAEVDALLARTKAAVAKVKAKRKPIAKAAAKPIAKSAPKAVAKPVAPEPKPMSRRARLAKAEAEIKASKPKDARLVWRGMTN